MWLEGGVVRQIGPATEVLDAYEDVHGGSVKEHA
jgi:hypothetical protein